MDCGCDKPDKMCTFLELLLLRLVDVVTRTCWIVIFVHPICYDDVLETTGLSDIVVLPYC